jgi:parallel beta-helix repeat protein
LFSEEPRPQEISATYVIDGKITDNLSDYYDFVSGNGTMEDPYLVSGIILDNTELPYVNCIEIRDVTQFLKIENCTLTNRIATRTLHLYHSANIQIYNNTLTGGDTYLTSCENISIRDNIITGKGYHGIDLRWGFNVTIQNNVISSYDFGIAVDNCWETVVQNNLIQNADRAGINLRGFRIHPDYGVIFVTVRGKYPQFCTVIFNNTIRHNENGIQMIHAQGMVIDSNLVEHNKRVGIRLYDSHWNNITQNVIHNSRYGISFENMFARPVGIGYSMPDTFRSSKNLLQGNHIYDISLKPIKPWIGNNISLDNRLEQNIWSAILFFIGLACTIAGLSFVVARRVNRRREIKQKLKAYEDLMVQPNRIKELEGTLADFKKKYFELEAELNRKQEEE